MSSSGTARSHGRSTFSFLGNIHTVLHSGYTKLQSHQKCRRLSFSPHTLQHLLFVFISSVQLLSCVRLFATPWTAACQASLSLTNTQSVLRLMSIESVMPSNHLILCPPLLLPPSIFPSMRVFSNDSALCIWWPRYWPPASVLSMNSQC